MRLFHVREEKDIQIFEPRLPSRNDLDQTVGLVWAIDKDRFPNFLRPRNCRGVAYDVGNHTTALDRTKFFPLQLLYMQL